MSDDHGPRHCILRLSLVGLADEAEVEQQVTQVPTIEYTILESKKDRTMMISLRRKSHTALVLYLVIFVHEGNHCPSQSHSFAPPFALAAEL